MKKVLVVGAFLLVAVVAGVFFVFNLNKSEEETTARITPQSTNETEVEDFKASFAIYTNGTFRIFTDSRYHNLSEDVFIEASSPNVVNVKTSNITWGDFFATLPMKLEKDCLTTGTGQEFCTNQTYTLQFFINGKPDPNALDKSINEGDKLLVTYDTPNSPRIQEQINSVPDVK